MLFVKLNGLAGLAQAVVGTAEVAQRGPFASAVANLSVNCQRLLVKLNGLAGLVQGGVGDAEVAQRVAFASAVASFAGNC